MDWDWEAVTKLLHRPATTIHSVSDDNSVGKLKKSLRDYISEPDDEEIICHESLLAELFAGIAAVKAAYAELQSAQHPYDPKAIRLADRSIVSEMKLLSRIKRFYYLKIINLIPVQNIQHSQLREQQNLIKTFEITIKKMESDLHDKDVEIKNFRFRIQETETANRSLECKLHYSCPDQNHFLVALRYAVTSMNSFTKLMIKKMESSGWDLDSAAEAVYPNIRSTSRNRFFFFQSFVCLKIFSDFNRRDFNLSFLEHRSSWDRRDFFREFTDSKFSNTKQFLDRYGKFVKAKYSSLVHPKMELAFFGESGRAGYRDSKFFIGFAEMVRRVWVLHCCFFSLAPDLGGTIFRARNGCRFSEVYMKSVSDQGPSPVPVRTVPTVGFTVVPGFRFGSTVIQCKVYLSS